MNGVCAKRLLDNVDGIFEKIEDMIRNKMTTTPSRNPSDIPKLTLVVQKFKRLLDTIDLVFLKARQIYLSPEEIEQAKMLVRKAEELWNDLDLNVTPKFHILIAHTIDQMVMYDGIADKVEDFVEKSHQVGKRLDHLVARMKTQSFEQQELVKIRRQ